MNKKKRAHIMNKTWARFDEMITVVFFIHGLLVLLL